VRKLIIAIIAVVFVLALSSVTWTYQVRFTEAAVLTTFGKATSSTPDPGLKFKWPYPIQSVTKYDTRLRFLQARLETQQTADDRQVAVEAFATWRVKDPDLFFQRFSNAGERAPDHYRKAEELLDSALRSAMARTSRYRMGDLFTRDESRSKLGQLEADILEALRSTGDASGQALDQYGIEVADVGINRIVVPADTSEKIFEAMGAERDLLAQSIQSRGDAEAETIRSGAEASANKILAFARRRAAEIQSRGDEEASKFLAQLRENPDLAVFLRNIELMKESLGKRVTLIVPFDLPGMKLFSPNALNEMSTSNGVPDVLGSEKPASTNASAEDRP
jgi:membrane protease subunit HflC